mgnify:CR=1 FL=1
MQKFVSKYGLAAHLALLAVAPLFLFPFCGEAWTARVLLWLSLFAGDWILMEPSRRSGEMLHDARFRVASGIIRDPLFWLMLFIVLFAAVRCLNGGVAMKYDAEGGDWTLTSPAVVFLPGCVKDAGFLPFSVAVAATAVVQGCRHALGRSARMAYLLTSSVLAGIAALAAAIVCSTGNSGVLKIASCGYVDASYAGVAFGVHFLASIVAIVGMFEHGWKRVMPLALVGTGGTGIGLFCFAPLPMVLVWVAAAVLMLVFALTYVGVKVGGIAIPKSLILFSISLLLPVLFVIGVMPAELRESRLAYFTGGGLFPENFEALRGVLSSIAAKAWGNHPWIGSGLGSFALDIRFNATDADWAVLTPGQLGALNGWWQLLAERGIAGSLFLVAPLAFLFWTYFVRLAAAVSGVRSRGVAEVIYPMAFLGFLSLASVVVCGFVDHSFFRAETLLAVAATVTLAGSSLPAVKKQAPAEMEK